MHRRLWTVEGNSQTAWKLLIWKNHVLAAVSLARIPMAILDERGLFWWHDEEVPAGQFAPDSCVHGRCSIDDAGKVLLELDACLSDPRIPMAAFSGEPISRHIQGVLKGTNESIRLTGVRGNGGQFRTEGISSERYVATNALVGSGAISQAGSALTFDTLEMPLTDFKEWLCLASVTVTRTDGRIVVAYEPPTDVVRPTIGGSIAIVFGIGESAAWASRASEYALNETALLRLQLNLAVSMSEWQKHYVLLCDFMKLLTNSDHSMDWPCLISNGVKLRWYFNRGGDVPIVGAPNRYEIIIPFPKISSCFGEIWTKWTEMNEKFGPGIYLYFGTRRGATLYAEHQFVNLIWGLETFHRIKFGAAEPTRISPKIDRIICEISNPRDRKWLAAKLKFAHEPPLSERLRELVGLLPYEFEAARLQKFATECADRRNDISHYGGRRDAASYSEFILDLHHKSAALSILYHALLLNEVDVDQAIISEWLNRGFLAGGIKRVFADVELLDPKLYPPPGTKQSDGSVSF
jgi:hypothetical protein